MTKTLFATRRGLLKGGAAAVAGAALPLSFGRSARAAAGAQAVNMQLGWIAGGETIGEIAAKRLGYFAEEKIDFAIQAGGPNIYGVAVVAACRVRYRNNFPTAATESVLARIAEGLRLVRNDKRLIGTLTITVIYNVFGWPFTSMVPVIGQDRLLLGPEGIGILASMDGIGAFAGAVLMAMLVRPSFASARPSPANRSNARVSPISTRRG